MNKFFILIFFMLAGFSGAFAQDNSADDLFSDSNTVVETTNIFNNSIISNVDRESFTITGAFYSLNSYSLSRDFILGRTNTDWLTNSSFNSSIAADLIGDIRLRKGLKGFISASVYYYPAGQQNFKNTVSYTFVTNMPLVTNIFGPSTNILPGGPVSLGLKTNYSSFYETNYAAITLKEFFADLNIGIPIATTTVSNGVTNTDVNNFKMYFKIGKQVLQWGRCYFWQPTDLVNIDRKTFADLSQSRTLEGTYGVKMTVPFGTWMNIYGFTGLSDITRLDQPSIAGKLEFLVGGVEFAFSGWAKKDYLPVYGLDMSFRIPWINVDVAAEASISWGDNKNLYAIDTNFINFQYYSNSTWYTNVITNYYSYKLTNQWVPRAAISLSRSFDFMDVPNRIMVVGEFFYNYAGYTTNIFSQIKQALPDPTMRMMQIGLVYQPNYHAMFYGALFVSVAQFLLNEMTLNLNAIGNFNDMSFMVSGGLSYNPIFNFTLNWNVTGAIGSDDSEYTFTGMGISTGLNATMTF